jgi:hypothetical protein
LIAAIYRNEISHINFLNNFFHNIAIKNRKYVFSYIDTKEDFHLLQFFNLRSDNLPKIIIYDFSKGKYFIDNFSHHEDEHNNSMIKLNELVQNIEAGNLKWTTGYLIDDILSMMGISISRTSMTIIFIGLFTTIIVILIICCLSLFQADEEKKTNSKAKIKKIN